MSAGAGVSHEPRAGAGRLDEISRPDAGRARAARDQYSRQSPGASSAPKL
ncbi:hypothetical protein SCE1572_00970 [Sorangium cellulosum So0157-2]|uniref:Uncharacterized protein n=1 Tax=Sorangium cellulosum So0157-2 TaxID=1254432 RepID=S4XJ60_SORCE|nr:hypothetical protein SCE1572_00970 [Sorangium cellulosum So0157-2]